MKNTVWLKLLMICPISNGGSGIQTRKKKNGFYIQGYLPHSFNPDFILETKTGCIIAVEYKGEHLADREYKEKIGNIWGSINEKYKFIMATKSDIEEKSKSDRKL